MKHRVQALACFQLVSSQIDHAQKQNAAVKGQTSVQELMLGAYCVLLRIGKMRPVHAVESLTSAAVQFASLSAKDSDGGVALHQNILPRTLFHFSLVGIRALVLPSFRFVIRMRKRRT